MNREVRGLVVAGTHSSVGKTTATLGLMAALRRRGWTVQPYKVGPDFIDPGHHAQVADRPSRNLDGWILSKEENRAVFARHCADAEAAVVEGVMGLFDGHDVKDEDGSTAQIAKWLDLPVLLIVDARAMAKSAAAVVHGFSTFDPGLRVSWVVCNRIGSAGHLRLLHRALEDLPGIRVLGGLPQEANIAIPARHLGLVTGDDHPLDRYAVERLADLMESHLDMDAFVQELPVRQVEVPDSATESSVRIRLGIARDPAFCFYYPDNLDWLRRFGAELVPFSPLADVELPASLDGIYLGGGYPELYADRLADNEGMRDQIRRRAESGTPIYAECGGMMYLCRGMYDQNGEHHPMVDVFPWEVRMSMRFRALGYREVILAEGGPLGPSGTCIRGHEFHYSEVVSDPGPVRRLYRVSNGRRGEPRSEGFHRWNVLASYVHLHFGSNPEAARHFVEFCHDRRHRP